MKRFIIILVSTLALVSCEDQVSRVSGTYAYKISGNVTVDEKERSLPVEEGAMEVIRLSADSALLTFNVLRGGVYTTYAEIANQEIVLAPYTRSLTIGVKEYTVTVSGEGTIYDGTIVVDLNYDSAEVFGEGLTLLCKKN